MLNMTEMTGYRKLRQNVFFVYEFFYNGVITLELHTQILSFSILFKISIDIKYCLSLYFCVLRCKSERFECLRV